MRVYSFNGYLWPPVFAAPLPLPPLPPPLPPVKKHTKNEFHYTVYITVEDDGMQLCQPPLQIFVA